MSLNTLKCAFAIIMAFMLTPLTSALQAQTNRNYSYSDIIPNLQILQTGYSGEVLQATSGDLVYEYYKLPKKRVGYNIMGLSVTSSEVMAFLKMSKYEKYTPVPDVKIHKNDPEYPWQTDDGSVLKELNIYCDSFSLTQNMWLPECNLTIHARKVNPSTFSINTTPQPWRKAYFPEEVPQNEAANGKNGKNGGDIQIITADNILLFTADHISQKNSSALVSNGSNGEHVCVPKVTVKTPTLAPSSMNLYCDYPEKGITSGKSKDTNLGTDIIGLILTKEYGWSNGFYERYWMPDNNLELIYKHDKDRLYHLLNNLSDLVYIKDRIEYSRIETDTTNPGNGGNGGKINILQEKYFYFSPSPPEHVAQHGQFTMRSNHDLVSYLGGNSTLFEADNLTIRQPTYTIKYYEMGKSVVGVCSSIFKSSGTVSGIPSTSAINKAKENLKLSNRSVKPGLNGQYKKDKKPYLPHHKYLIAHLNSCIAQYQNFDKLDTKAQANLERTVEKLLTDSEKISDPANLTPPALAALNLASNRALLLKNSSNKNLDDFNNFPGFRPVLSLSVTLDYLKNNLEKDIEMYVWSDLGAIQEALAGDLMNKADGMIKDLEADNKTQVDKIGKNNDAFKKLQGEAEICRIATDSIRIELAAKEAEIAERYKNDQKTIKMWQGILNVVALGASIIPWGQPALKEIAGNTLMTISNSLGKPDETAWISTSEIMNKMDISKVMKGFNKGEIKDLTDAKYNSDLLVEMEEAEKKGEVYRDKVTNKTILETEMTRVNGNKKRFTNIMNNTKEVLNNYNKNSMTADQMRAELDRRLNSHYELKKLHYRINEQITQKEAIFKDLEAVVQKILETDMKIQQNNFSMYHLKYLQFIKEDFYNQNMQNQLTTIRDASLERIKWLEYQLVKTYEYTTLEKYASKMPSFDVLQVIYKRKKEDLQNKSTITRADLDALVVELKNTYEAKVQEMKGNIIRKANNSYQEDDASKTTTSGAKYGRKVVLTEALHPALFAKLNQGERITIDFQKDLVDEIIKPNQSEIRIMDISIDKVVLEQTLPKGVSLDISLYLDKHGVLRKGDRFYQFYTDQTGDGSEETPDKWEWTVSNINDTNELSNTSVASSRYTDLIKNVTGSTESRAGVFTLAPAWTKAYIQTRPIGTNSYQPQVKQIYVSVRCEYKSIQNNTQKVLDLKMNNAPSGTLFQLTKDGQTETLSQGLYKLVNNNSSYTLKLDQVDAPTGWVFDHWEAYPLNLLSETQRKNSTITFTIKEDTRIRPVFVEQKVKSSRPGVQNITLYNEPSLTSSIIAKVHDPVEYVILEPDMGNGFMKVVYGVEIAYIKIDKK